MNNNIKKILLIISFLLIMLICLYLIIVGWLNHPIIMLIATILCFWEYNHPHELGYTPLEIIFSAYIAIAFGCAIL